MHIAVLGATGRTGRPLVTEAVRRGHTVAALVRDPAAADLPAAVTVHRGDARDPEAVRALVDGADAVLSALGPRKGDTTLHRDADAALIGILSESSAEVGGPRRFVGVSGAGIDVPDDAKRRRDRVISALMQRLGGSTVRDKEHQYRLWAASDLDWTLVRAPRLADGDATGRVDHDAHRSARSTSITRADLAAFLLDCVEQQLYPRQAPLVAGG